MMIDEAVEGLKSNDPVTQMDTIRSLPKIPGAHLSVEVFSALGRIYKADPESPLGQAAKETGLALHNQGETYLRAQIRRPVPAQPLNGQHPS